MSATEPYQPPAAELGPTRSGDGGPKPVQLGWVMLGVLVSFLAELTVTAGAAAAYIGVLYPELVREPEAIFWQVADSPFLRMVSALSGLPSTMLGGFVAARKAVSRPRAHAVLVAITYASLLALVARLLLAWGEDGDTDYVTYAATLTGTLVGGFLGGLFAARGRPG